MSISRLQSQKFKFSLWTTVTLLFLGLISISAFTYAKNAVRQTQTIPADVTVDKVYVDKSERVLKLLSGDKVIKTYHIALGDSPAGHKRQQGDERTPEGVYRITYRNDRSRYHLSLRISYPDQADRGQARARGVDPGGDIMIHGATPPGRAGDWTDGCIAVTDTEIEDIWRRVPVGTPIRIDP